MSRFEKACNIVIFAVFVALLLCNGLIDILPEFKEFLYHITGKLSGLFKNISLAYIGSYVFYFFQALLPNLLASHNEKKCVRSLLNCNDFYDFMAVFLSYYDLPKLKRIFPGTFLPLEKLPENEYYIVDIIEVKGKASDIHCITAPELTTFNSAIESTLDSMVGTLESFLHENSYILCNSDFTLRINKIIENAKTLSSIYKESCRKGIVVSQLDTIAWQLYSDWRYIIKKYNLTINLQKSHKRVLKTKQQSNEFLSKHNKQIRKAISDITTVASVSKKVTITISSRPQYSTSLYHFFNNREYDAQQTDDQLADVVVSSKNTTLTNVFVFGVCNLSLGRVVLLKRDYDVFDLCWLENVLIQRYKRIDTKEQDLKNRRQ